MPDTGNKNFRITMGKGFQMKFPNGVCVSVQWGYANYCERFSVAHNLCDEAKQVLWDSNDAEIMAWVEKDEASSEDRNSIIKKLYPGHTDVVMGHVGSMEVLEFLNKCANY